MSNNQPANSAPAPAPANSSPAPAPAPAPAPSSAPAPASSNSKSSSNNSKNKKTEPSSKDKRQGIRDKNKGNVIKRKLKTKTDKKTGETLEFEGIDVVQTIIQGLFTVVSGGAFGILSVIMFVLKAILYILYYLFVKIIPFIVMYIGIPTFILGVIMGLFFLGGHLLFVIVFIVGLFLYLKNMFSVIYSLPTNKSDNIEHINTNDIKVKI